MGWALAVALSSAPALAEERFDHRGAVGLLAGAGLEHRDTSPAELLDTGRRLDLDLGATLAVGYDGNELKAIARAALGGPLVDWSLTAGYRGYFGQERVKTFFDLDASLHVGSAITAGPRVGFGLQLELSPIAGLYAAAGARLGFGGAFRFGAELLLGLQLRSYLLE